MSKIPTFTKAREALFAELRSKGWQVVTFSKRTMKPLKIPYAINLVGTRIEFAPQSVHYRHHDALNDNKVTHSLFVDIRHVSPVQFETQYRELFADERL